MREARPGNAGSVGSNDGERRRSAQRRAQSPARLPGGGRIWNNNENQRAGSTQNEHGKTDQRQQAQIRQHLAAWGLKRVRLDVLVSIEMD